MNPTPTLKVRRSVEELQNEYSRPGGDKKPLLNLLRAWQGIKDLPYHDPRSFFALGGYHGEPFRGAGEYNSASWGGYCNHGNVLFPTWHRVYCLKLEEALQSMPGCEQVMLPYWDETSPESLAKGIPWLLTRAQIETETPGEFLPNPLLSYQFPLGIVDQATGDGDLYSKPQGYTTVRYPLSGLVGTPAQLAYTAAHNAQYPDYEQNVEILNLNVVNWLRGTVAVPNPRLAVQQAFEDCLQAPNYTLFSNNTSARHWNSVAPSTATPVMALESPHGSLHLAIGGFDAPASLEVPQTPGEQAPPDFSPIADANGDMGENDTAGLDPIFYFHHCNIDRMFWIWQKQHNSTDHLDIISGYPGTNSSDDQGPTPGYAPNTELDLNSPLNPFQKYTGEVYTSKDCINIEKQLGYTYSVGSLDTEAAVAPAAAFLAEVPPPTRHLHVSNINRAPIKGSFIVAVYHHTGDTKTLIGYEPVLSRWDAMACSNCQTHLEVKASFPLPATLADSATEDDFRVHLIHRPQDTPYIKRFAAYNQAADNLRASAYPAEQPQANSLVADSFEVGKAVVRPTALVKPYHVKIK